MAYTKPKPPGTSAKNKEIRAQKAAIVEDISKINDALSNNIASVIKKLHRELDSKYSAYIPNWGHSFWGYNEQYGFAYDLLGEEALAENLEMMKAQLEGYILHQYSETEKVKTAHRMSITEGKTMAVQKKKLLRDYAEIKKSCSGNAAILIQDSDYPKYKNTLDYLEDYEYILSLNVNGSGHMYMKTDAFDSFTEHLLSQEEEYDMETKYNNKKVFVVHGHDHKLLAEVELMLHRLELKPIIVKNEANSGRTIIEKIEDLSDVGFGIVLYTSCDEGRKRGEDILQSRARQNVIFEHGYLYAKLGRGRVAALNDADVEIPSDLAGVLYISRSAPDWKNQLMREMKSAGLEFDSTKI